MMTRGASSTATIPDFRAHQEAKKFEGVSLFGRTLPLIRSRVEKDLAARDTGHDRAVAAIVRLLDEGHIRIGNDTYAKANKSYGASTLTMRHTELDGEHLTFRYLGKSSKEQRGGGRRPANWRASWRT